MLALDAVLQRDPPRGLVELVPSYRSLMAIFDPLETDYDAFRTEVMLAAELAEAMTLPEGRRWTVPVAYGGELGDDLAGLPGMLGLSETEIVALHAAASYRVYMIGFAPGFAYLGGLPKPLHIPRRAVPRPHVAASAVIIGGMQSAVTSVPTPTGWYMIGRTPVRGFDLRREAAFLFRAGDSVRFERIGHAEYWALEQRAALGEPVARLDCVG